MAIKTVMDRCGVPQKSEAFAACDRETVIWIYQTAAVDCIVWFGDDRTVVRVAQCGRGHRPQAEPPQGNLDASRIPGSQRRECPFSNLRVLPDLWPHMPVSDPPEPGKQ